MRLAGAVLAICGLALAGPAVAERSGADPSAWEFEPLAPGSVVAVALADAELVYTDHVWPGVVIAPDGWILASEKAVSGDFRTAVIERPGDTVAAIDAEVVAVLEPWHVALLHAPGLTRPAAGLNAAGALLREPVASWGWDDATCAIEACAAPAEPAGREGRVLRRIDCPFEDEPCWFYLHDAAIPEFGNGGPLANSCGEVVGINVVGPEHVPEELGGPVWYAVQLAEILHVLEGLGVPYVASEEPCVVPGEGGGEGEGEDGGGEGEGGESEGEEEGGESEGEDEGEEDGGESEAEGEGGEDAGEEDGGGGNGEEDGGQNSGNQGDDNAGDGSPALIPDREK